MLLLAVLFVAAVIGFGRWQGLSSLVGLAVSFAVIIGFVVPLTAALTVTFVAVTSLTGLGGDEGPPPRRSPWRSSAPCAVRSA